mmetsp:Transcript_10030/g.23903  ORF Transcript_10030/g.23903 Transcript_10030/m.23903 type:complete len:117 (-) Transcript_10030:2640-2990(-)
MTLRSVPHESIDVRSTNDSIRTSNLRGGETRRYQWCSLRFCDDLEPLVAHLLDYRLLLVDEIRTNRTASISARGTACIQYCKLRYEPQYRYGTRYPFKGASNREEDCYARQRPLYR